LPDKGFVQVENLQTGSCVVTFVHRFGNAPDLTQRMDENMNKDEERDYQEVQQKTESEILQEFIERKKLENRVLQEIIDKIKHDETINKLQTPENNH
jgi:hypothetical protein